ncbi:MAG TPA: HD domain-containing protein [Candidatus Deferrimicrobium sp.]|nr:HD domain-containing protein [Candidatus Deferrimicrobium sp.]
MTTLKDISSDIQQFAREKMVLDILHGFPHVERVLKYAAHVNTELNGNWEIIECAILLHDIGHKVTRERHNELSANIAKEFLLSKSIDSKTISAITNSILTHSRQFANHTPISTEGKVVFDADGMDLFGAIGLMRALLTCALRNEGIECMINRLEWRLAQKTNFFSQVAKKFVDQNSKIIDTYLNELKRQIELI